MDYAEGKLGRIFVARIDHGEDFLVELEDLAINEHITSAFFFLLGAAGSADVVVGPKSNNLPPEITWSQFDDARELLGVGNIFCDSGRPKVHLHAAVGKEGEFIMGCIREHSEVFMVIEVVIFEMERIMAERVVDNDLGFAPIRFFR